MCGLYDEVEVGIVVVFEDFGDVYGGVGVEVELVGDGVCALVFALVEFACLWCGDVEGRVEVGYGYRVDELAGLSDDSVGDDFGFFAGFAVVLLCPVADGFVLGTDVRVMGFEFGLFGMELSL